MNKSAKSNYNFVMALAFIGIGVWKMYSFFFGDPMVATYQVYISGLLVLLGFFQLYRWWRVRNEQSQE